jgi:hypothetical protein
MPCRCDDWEPNSGFNEAHFYKLEANAATRAACDMRTIIRRNGLENELTKETRNWIAKHDAADAIRIAEENAAGIRQKVKKQALDKLTLEERRVLGL